MCNEKHIKGLKDFKKDWHSKCYRKHMESVSFHSSELTRTQQYRDSSWKADISFTLLYPSLQARLFKSIKLANSSEVQLLPWLHLSIHTVSSVTLSKDEKFFIFIQYAVYICNNLNLLVHTCLKQAYGPIFCTLCNLTTLILIRLELLIDININLWIFSTVYNSK